ncbi:MAG: hypothetical protein PHU62_06015 [Bacteroidales bacterium]|jgi:hypothetical protein|nr:hypothetical protein [Bacteroidales bacterium]MDD3152263.1 hypothetical protein [Bacteroidales bacterium]MDD3914343.1 hypothetical protein [Bacteroidales bacterium]MDD4634108.1 hypothetical protein [Bacteroidales bacterium]
MNKLDLVLLPKVGIGNLKFGTTIDDVVKLLGEANEIEEFNDEDCFNTTLLTYYEQELDLFFEGSDKFVFSAIGVDNPDATLFGKKIFDMKEPEIIALMEENGYFEHDESFDEECNEKCISFEEACFDFYFEEDELISVNYGVLVSDDGQIVDI